MNRLEAYMPDFCLGSTNVIIIEDREGDLYVADWSEGEKLPKGWRVIRSGLSSYYQGVRVASRIICLREQEEKTQKEGR